MTPLFKRNFESNSITETQSFASDTLRRISRATTTAVGELDEDNQSILEVNNEVTPQFSHKIVVAIDFGTTYRYFKTAKLFPMFQTFGYTIALQYRYCNKKYFVVDMHIVSHKNPKIFTS